MKSSGFAGSSWWQNHKIFALVTMNSVLLYILAYIFLFLITRLMTALSAAAFNISSVIYYFKTDFFTHGGGWNRDSVTMIFSTGPAVSLVLGLAFLVFYGGKVESAGIKGVFITWLIILCLVDFTGELITGAVLNRGFGYTMMYWYIMDTGRVVLTLVLTFSLIFSGRELARFLLISGNVYFNDLKGNAKLGFTLCQFVLPYMISSIILQVCELPNFSLYTSMVRSTMALLLLSLACFCRSTPDLFFSDKRRAPSLSGTLLIITLLALVVYRLVFGIGIRVA